MPNNVENWLTIEGAEKHIKEVLTFIKSENSAFDFNELVPYPSVYQKLDDTAEAYEKANEGNETPSKWANRPKDGFNSGGMEWNVANWGTKWNAYSIKGPLADYSSESFSSAHIIFETAWSPPIPIMLALYNRFPNVSFTLSSFELGCQQYYEFSSVRQEYRDDEEGPYKPRQVTSIYTGSRGG